MVTTKIYYDKRAIKKDGTAPLKVAITKNGSTAYISLNIALTEREWDPIKRCIINHPKRQFFNTYVGKRKLEIDELVLSMDAKRELSGSVTEIKNKILALLNPTEERGSNSGNIMYLPE